MSIESIINSPAVGSSTPSITLMVVVLPAPLGPSKPDDLAASHGKRDILERRDAGVSLAQAR